MRAGRLRGWICKVLRGGGGERGAREGGEAGGGMAGREVVWSLLDWDWGAGIVRVWGKGGGVCTRGGVWGKGGYAHAAAPSRPAPRQQLPAARPHLASRLQPPPRRPCPSHATHQAAAPPFLGISPLPNQHNQPACTHLHPCPMRPLPSPPVPHLPPRPPHPPPPSGPHAAGRPVPPRCLHPPVRPPPPPPRSSTPPDPPGPLRHPCISRHARDLLPPVLPPPPPPPHPYLDICPPPPAAPLPPPLTRIPRCP